jgi:sugar phosphate isomerase/epimerase
MKFFVNLPLSWVYQDERWLDRLFECQANNVQDCKIGPELGLDEISLTLPLSWHKRIAERIKEQGCFCSAHLPFFMLPPGNVSSRLQGLKSLDILCKAADIANVYTAEHLIGHPGYIPATDSLSAVTSAGTENNIPSEVWLERSVAAWAKVAGITPARLFLENTHEISPLPLTALLSRLTDNHAGRENIAICFDIGHWYCFAGGSALHNLEEWIRAFSPWLGHLHLHDNDGTGDQHLGLGCAKIPFTDFFILLLTLNSAPGFTLEPHEIQDLTSSLSWMGQSPEMRLWAAKVKSSL